MIGTKFCATLLALSLTLGLQAQVTTNPISPTTDDKNIVVTFHAEQGNGGLKGVTADDPVYAHTGVITTKSSGDNDWKHAPIWGDNSEKYKMTYVAANTWQLTIPDINEYYGVDKDEIVTKLAFVFRNGDCTKEGKGTGNSDILVNIDGFYITFTSNAAGNMAMQTGSKSVTFTMTASKAGNLSIWLDGEQKTSRSNATTLSWTTSFTNDGNYVVTAKGNATGYPDREETINFLKVSGSPTVNYPGGVPKMGPVKNDDGTVTFCVAAPQQTSAILVGSWNDYQKTTGQVMNKQAVSIGGAAPVNFFWITVNGLDDETIYPYYFIFGNGKTIADPYARLALDQYDQYLNYGVPEELPAYPSQHVSNIWPLSLYQGKLDGDNYDWKVKDFKGPDPENLIIYEMLFRDFTGEEGQAKDDGNIRGAIEKFDHIKQLGVNAVELMPIMEFNGANSWGYNTNLYFAPDKAYGMPDDYKEFIDLCHQNGIAVILDIVFNQAQDHPWLTLYGSAAASPFFNATAPHDYSVLNDWNQDYHLVDQQWKDCLQYWLSEYHVDGFRFDLVKGLGDNNSYGGDTEAYNASRVTRMKKLHGYIKEINPNAYHINENLAAAKEENDMAVDGQLNWANINNAGSQYAMGYSNDATLGRMYAPNNDNRTWGSTVSYLESHDEQRLAYKQDQYAPASIKNNPTAKCQRLGSAAAQMILTPGAHMIWQFSELGNAQNTKNNDNSNITDCKIVNWNLKDDADHNALYRSYCELISLRTGYPELFSKDASVTVSCSTNQVDGTQWPEGNHYIYLVSADKSRELYAVMNPRLTGNSTVSLPVLKDGSNYEIVSSSQSSAPSWNVNTKELTVPANCYVVVASTGTTGIDDIAPDEYETFKAYGSNGFIVVENASGSVEVFSTDGRLVSRLGGSGRINLIPGIYIVQHKDQSVKVAVK